MGDYAPGDLSRAVNVDGNNQAIAEMIEKVAEPPVLIFSVDVAHAEAIAKAINDRYKRPYATALSAHSKDREESCISFQTG